MTTLHLPDRHHTVPAANSGSCTHDAYQPLHTIVRPFVRRFCLSCALLCGLFGATLAGTPAHGTSAASPLAMPASSVPHGLRVVDRASHPIDLAYIQQFSDSITTDLFHASGLQSAYEQRLESAQVGAPAGTRVLIDAFAFATADGARQARSIWTWETAGDLATLPSVPNSAQVFQHLTSGPGVPGWEVEVIFRLGPMLVDVDARYPGQTMSSQHSARSLATHVTQRYAEWINSSNLTR